MFVRAYFNCINSHGKIHEGSAIPEFGILDRMKGVSRLSPTVRALVHCSLLVTTDD